MQSDSATCLSSKFLPCNTTLTFSLDLWTAYNHVLVALMWAKGQPKYPHSHMVKTASARRKSYEIRAHFDIYQVLNSLSETSALLGWRRPYWGRIRGCKRFKRGQIGVQIIGYQTMDGTIMSSDGEILICILINLWHIRKQVQHCWRRIV